MKSLAVHFPHIFRKITAGVEDAFKDRTFLLWWKNKKLFLKKYTKKINLLKIAVVLGCLYFLFLGLPFSLSSFEKAKLSAYSSTNNAQIHSQLSDFFVSVNNYDRAEKEIKIAASLAPQNNQYQEKLTKILAWQHKPEELKRQLLAWQKISYEKPGFRDGFFAQAIILYQLKNFLQAKEVLQKVFELDPNFEPGRRLEKVLLINNK